MFGYNNIGRKIKCLAVVIFISEAIIAIIYGISLISNNSDNMMLFGVLIAILGPIIAWISSWLLYGFGQLVENTDVIASNSNSIAEATDIMATFHE